MEKTTEQVSDEFIGYVNHLFKDATKDFSEENKEKIHTMVFSMLVGIDGESMALPGFILAPNPHKDDKEYNKKEGNDYYPQNHNAKVNCDIGGNLHDKWCNLDANCEGDVQ